MYCTLILAKRLAGKIPPFGGRVNNALCADFLSSSAYASEALSAMMSNVIDVKHPNNPTFRAGRELEGEAAQRLLTIFRQFFEECSVCLEKGASFAGIVMGGSALEALLMLASIAYKNDVIDSETWQRHSRRRKNKTFLESLTHCDLSELTAIGLELKWFGLTRIPKFFPEHLPGVDFSPLNDLIAGKNTVSMIAPVMVRLSRNYLHPGKMLRDNVVVEENDKRLAIFFLLFAIFSFLEQHSATPPLHSI